MKIIDEKSFKILLATEDLNYRKNIAAKLRFEGFDIEFSNGGFHLLHLLEKNTVYNLIIIHENMEDMSGHEIIMLIRTTKSKTELPIMFISKDQKEEALCDTILVGANDYIIQGTNFNPITERVKKYFQSLSNS